MRVLDHLLVDIGTVDPTDEGSFGYHSGDNRLKLRDDAGVESLAFLSDIPAPVTIPAGAVTFKGTWDASAAANPGGAPSTGDLYIASADGNGFTTGDFIIYDGAAWQRIEGQQVTPYDDTALAARVTATETKNTAQDTAITNAANRANHTGSQTASTISDFNTAVDARLPVQTVSAVANIAARDAITGSIAGDVAVVANDGAYSWNGTAWTKTSDLSPAAVSLGKFAADVGGAATVTINHALGSLDVIAQVRNTATGEIVGVTPVVVDANNVSFTFATAPAAGAYRAVIIG